MKLKTILNQSFEDLNKLTKEQALEQSKVLVKTLERRVKSLYKTRGEGKQYIRIPSQYFYTRGKKAGQLKLKMDEGATRNKALSKLTDLIRATNNPETLSSFQIQQFNEVNERLASYGLKLSARDSRRFWKIYERVKESNQWFFADKSIQGSERLQQFIADEMKRHGGSIDKIVDTMNKDLDDMYRATQESYELNDLE